MAYSLYSNKNAESETKYEIIPVENCAGNMKNISPFMSKDLIAAAGFNIETPIVEAIIGNLTGTLSTRKNESEMIKCKICDCELSSNIALTIHTKGLKHKKKLKALEILEQLKDSKDIGVYLGDHENPNLLRCEICSKSVNSAQQLEVHLSSAKHKRKVVTARVHQTVSNPLKKKCEGEGNLKGSPEQKKKKDESKLICCDICNISMNSQIQYDEHLLSKRHLTKSKRTAQKLATSRKYNRHKSIIVYN